MGVRQRHRQHFKFDTAACGSEDAGALKWNNSASFTPALHMKGETFDFCHSSVAESSSQALCCVMSVLKPEWEVWCCEDLCQSSDTNFCDS